MYILMYRYDLGIQLLQGQYIYIYTYTQHFVFALVGFDVGLPGRLLVDIIVPVELF